MSFKNAKIVGSEVLPADYLKDTAPRGDAAFTMSSSALRSFAHCPSRWRAGYEHPDSDAKDFGSLLDCVLLTPAQLNARYAIAPATYETSGMQCPQCGSITDSKKCRACQTDRKEIVVTKDWDWHSKTCQEWREKQPGREVITSAELIEANAAASRLRADELLGAFVEGSNKQVWVAAEWHDEPTGLVVPVKGLIDLVPRADSEFSKCLGDLKSTRTAAVMAWQRDCFRMGYFIQAAFYTDLYVAATGEDRNTWCFILLENYLPWEPGRRMLSQDFLALGHAEYTRLLGNYCACLKAGRWPGYDDTDESIQGWSLVEPAPFMAEAAAFAPKFDFEPPEDAPLSDPDDYKM